LRSSLSKRSWSIMAGSLLAIDCWLPDSRRFDPERIDGG
jgi:hypothetical protein